MKNLHQGCMILWRALDSCKALSIRELVILVAIDSFDESTLVTCGKIAEVLGAQESTIKNRLIALKNKGFISRQQTRPAFAKCFSYSILDPGKIAIEQFKEKVIRYETNAGTQV